MMDKLYAVIMAGGRGERFWPLSTSRRPKQLLSLVGGKPMLSLAVEYLDGLIPPERILVITSADIVDATVNACPELPMQNVIGEPFGRDTAAVCALASAMVKARSGNSAFCILTADHIIRDIPVFREVIGDSFKRALADDILITIGIKPTFPSTGFGYIEAGESIKGNDRTTFMKARRFVEKPDLRTAEEYVETGRFFWNSGMFIWSVEAIQKALKTHSPALFRMAERMTDAVDKPAFDDLLRQEYSKLEKISIDYAIMEKASNIVMAKGTFRWDDVGAWPALQHHFEPDPDGNIAIGTCEALDSAGNIVVSPNRLTALVGVKDLVVVHAENATLICPKDRAQDVKKMVQHLSMNDKYRDYL